MTITPKIQNQVNIIKGHFEEADKNLQDLSEYIKAFTISPEAGLSVEASEVDGFLDKLVVLQGTLNKIKKEIDTIIKILPSFDSNVFDLLQTANTQLRSLTSTCDSELHEMQKHNKNAIAKTKEYLSDIKKNLQDLTIHLSELKDECEQESAYDTLSSEDINAVLKKINKED